MQLNESEHSNEERRSRGGTAELLSRSPQTEQQQPQPDRSDAPLLPESETANLQSRWEDCQRSFVDEPRDAVQQADELVAEVMRMLASQFADTRGSLESQWARGDNVSTEDLRIALQRYRDFFHRLLAV